MSTHKIAILDLDDTLTKDDYFGYVLCNDTIIVLEYLKKKQVKIVMATHNYDANNIAHKLGIFKYFDLILSYHDYTDKLSHINTALKIFNFEPSDAIFYDDLYENIFVDKNRFQPTAENICSARKYGIKTVHVGKNGILIDQVDDKF